MTSNQLLLPLWEENIILNFQENYFNKLSDLLRDDLDFQGQTSSFASHNFHSFPAKFPFQLPRKFIKELTNPGAIVLDPMVGSGTTILEALLLGRAGIGYDIDPLALLISTVKVTQLEKPELILTNNRIITNAIYNLDHNHSSLERGLSNKWDRKSKEFIDFWFAPETQIELLSLVNEINEISDTHIKAFFQLILSAIIITKSGGVSNAFDLGHTRPHRAKIVISKSGDIIIGKELEDDHSPRIKFLTKKLDSAILDFKKRFDKNLSSVLTKDIDYIPAKIELGNAEKLPLESNSVDLIFTSPPYASNAIDYMRAHKFSLIWLGYTLDQLSQKRKEYIGGEDTSNSIFEKLPYKTTLTVEKLHDVDEKESKVLHRYFSEMTRVLTEMYRVLKPNTASLVVVGNSTLSGINTKTHECLVEIGQSLGFKVPKIGFRNLDRNKRMLPASLGRSDNSQIQKKNARRICDWIL